MKSFRNALVYIGGRGLVRTSVSFDTRIRAFGEETGEPAELPEDAIVLPGFLDEHVHGAGGSDAMDGTQEALSVIARTLAAEGTTGFLATTMTQSPERIGRALSAAKTYREARHTEGAELLGVHLEGPFISAAHAGAQPREYIVPPSAELFGRFWEESGGCIRIVTLAPEERGAEELIRLLVSRGILPSVGHTSAKYEDVARAAHAGARLVTHTYNAQSPLHHREIGTVGSALLLDGLVCELICDTIHVSVPAMRLLFKCKGAGRVCLITDAMRAKGLPDGESELGGQKVYVSGGEARLADGSLAGSVLKMNVAVKNLVEKVGLTVEEAADCASIVPARNLGLDGETGSIELGKRADFAVLRGDFSTFLTVRGGETVFRA